MVFTHLFMGFSAICFPICFPILGCLGKHGETFGESFFDFCVDLRDFAFHSLPFHHPETSLFIGFPAIFRRSPHFMYVELEGVEHKSGNLCV